MPAEEKQVPRQLGQTLIDSAAANDKDRAAPSTRRQIWHVRAVASVKFAAAANAPSAATVSVTMLRASFRTQSSGSTT